MANKPPITPIPASHNPFRLPVVPICYRFLESLMRALPVHSLSCVGFPRCSPVNGKKCYHSLSETKWAHGKHERPVHEGSGDGCDGSDREAAVRVAAGGRASGGGVLARCGEGAGDAGRKGRERGLGRAGGVGVEGGVWQRGYSGASGGRIGRRAALE